MDYQKDEPLALCGRIKVSEDNRESLLVNMYPSKSGILAFLRYHYHGLKTRTEGSVGKSLPDPQRQVLCSVVAWPSLFHEPRNQE